MKNNGSTLVELIITITLIAIISVSIGVSINGMLSRQEEDQAEQYAKDIADAACVYAEVNDITTNSTVTINELISAGLLSKDLINPISDRPTTDYNDNEVTITWSNNEKTCSYTVPELSGNS